MITSFFARLPALAVVSIAILSVALTACDRATQPSGSGKSAMEQIQSTRTVTAGWAPYAPYAFLDPNTRKPTGFYVDAFERMAAEAKYKVDWVETTWGNMIADLKTGRFQVMAAPVFRTIPRATEVAFTRAIDYFGLSAIARVNDTRFNSLDDLRRAADIQIAVTQGEVGHEFATRNLPNAKLRVFDTGNIALALTDVVQGRVDVAISDAWTIKQFVAQHKGEVRDLFPTEPFNKVGAGWFVARNDIEFLTFLNTAVDWLVSSGEVAQIAKKYELGSQPVDR